MNSFRALTALLCVLLAGCISVMPTKSGRPIDTEFVKSMVKGKTTMDEVRAKLGAPSSVSQSIDEVQWSFTHWEGKPAMLGATYSKSTTQMLIVRFRGGKVHDYTLSSSAR